MLSAKWRAERWDVLSAINHTCQAVDQESCQLFLACCHCFLNFSVFWSSECVWPCFWVSLPPFYPRWQHAPPQPTIKALIRSEVLSNTLATYCLRSHTSTPTTSNISLRGRKGCIYHPDRAWMERDIPPLSPHTHVLSEIYSTRL